MASLSNINGLFDVHSTGAILFSTSHGTSGQILRSNGNAAPTWIPQSDIVGAYLPLAGGTLTGATATASGISFTVGGALTVSGNATASRLFSGDGGNKTNPMIANGSDEDTGIFFPSANVMAFTAGDTEALRFTSGNSTFTGIVGMGSTGIYAGTNAQLNLPGRGLAIKNDKNGSDNNWSYIYNTGTLSQANIDFVTGIGTALTLNHDKSATFTSNVFARRGSFGTASNFNFDLYCNGNAYINDELTVDDNATFAGSITVSGISSTLNTGNSGSFVTNDTNNYPRISTASANIQLGLFRTTTGPGGVYMGGFSGGFEVRNGSTLAPIFNVDQSGNGDFAGSALLDGLASDGYRIYKIRLQAPYTGGWGSITPGTVIGGLQQTNYRTDGGASNIAAAIDFELQDNIYGTGQTRISFKCGGVNGVDSEEKMRIQSNGNVLMGTTGATNTRLKVVQNANSEWACQITNIGTSAYGLAVDTTANTGVFSLAVYTNTGTGMFVRNEGKVGIGTVSPTSKLDISDPVDRVMNASGEGQFEITGNGYTFGIAMGDTTTALYHNSSLRSLTLGTDETPRLTILGGGNVGIGTTSPDSLLQLESSANPDVELKISNTATVVPGNNFGGSKVRLIADGTNGDGLGALRHALVSETDSYENWEIRSGNSLGTLCFDTLASERMRVTSSGHILFGTTTVSLTSGNGFKYHDHANTPYFGYVVNTTSGNGYSNFHHYNTNAAFNGFRFYITNNGGIYNYAANNVNLSDERVKHNIENSGNYLDKICSIPVRLFNYKDEPEGTGKNLGVIAQEVEAVAPELVNNDGFGETPEDGIELKTVYSTDMMYALMKAIQELEAKIKILENK